MVTIELSALSDQPCSRLAQIKGRGFSRNDACLEADGAVSHVQGRTRLRIVGASAALSSCFRLNDKYPSGNCLAMTD